MKWSLGTLGISIVIKNIQISTVLDVSMVDLCALEAFLVTVTPKALNVAIEKHMQMLNTRIKGLALKSLKARMVSSSLP